MKMIYWTILSLLLCGQPVFSQTTPSGSSADIQSSESPGTVLVMPPVVVRASHLEPGTDRVGGRELEMMPSTTGSITEALKGQSQIQYEYDQQSSLTLGEIAPPRISIFGAKPYENNFMIDGMSVSNSLNPSGLNNFKSAVELSIAGGDATIFYDTGLIDSVTVYSSNIPAQYGGFVGGVVDARLRDPRSDRWRYRIGGRYTNDSWFDLRDEDKESTDSNNQPRFKIYRVGMAADGPIHDRASLLLSLSRHHSTIPLTRINTDGTPYKDSQERTNENYFARLSLTPHHDLSINFDLTYAPYSALFWDSTFRDSEWTIENRSWRFATQFEYQLVHGVLTGKALFARHGFSRDSVAADRYSGPDDKFGGLGDTKNKTREVRTNIGFLSDDIVSGRFHWNYAAGLEYGYKHTDMWNEGIVFHSVTTARRTIQSYEEISQSRHNSNLGAYTQVEAQWHKLLIRPGIRVDYDRFSGNTDVAPRLKSEYDLFDNNFVRLDVGINRYYGQHLSAYAFRRHRPIHTQIFDIQPDASEIHREPTLSTSRNYSSDGLSTPYSDELSGGISGSLPAFEYGVSVVYRKHRKQLISKSRDGISYFLTNDGKSDYKGLTGYVSRTVNTRYFGNHRLSLNATKSKTYSVTGYYDSDIRESLILQGYDLQYNTVFYNGQFMARSDLPAENYNAPLIVALTFNSSFYDDRLRFMSIVRWRDSGKGLVVDRRVSDETPYGTTSGSGTSVSYFWVNPDGGYSQAYRSGKITGGAITDLTIEYDLYRKMDRTFTVVGEVVNIFNGRMETGQVVEDTKIVNHGRGFYAGFQMSF